MSVFLAAILWVVGDGYIGKYEDDRLDTHPIAASSVGFDREKCRLWVAEESTGKLLRLEPKASRVVDTGVGDVLSPAGFNRFFTRSTDRTTVAERDPEGNVVKTHKPGWAPTAVGMVDSIAGLFAVNFIQREFRLWLSFVGPDLGEKVKVDVPVGQTFWTNPRVVEDVYAPGFWLGYTTAGPGSPTAPRVERRGVDGAVMVAHQWNDRGYLHDICSAPGALLVARDIPSTSGFTVPVHSYIERVDPLGKVSRRYASDTNWLIDALGCAGDSVYLAQRSIFGSDGTYLLRLEKNETKAKELLRLPRAVKSLHSCEPLR